MPSRLTVCYKHTANNKEKERNESEKTERQSHTSAHFVKRNVSQCQNIPFEEKT